MIEQLASPSGVSLVEAVLARLLIALSGREYLLDDFRPHGRAERSSITAPEVGSPGAIDRATEPPPSVEEPAASHERDEDHGDHEGADVPELEVDDRFPGLARFGRLLEVGAGHLDRARAAHQEQCRQAAVQARALAAFAAARPAALLDRPEEEIGAAAAASRAGRPAPLTEVSEWAVDEVMVALSLSAQTAGGLLADSITLAQRLPATLDALEAGRIGWPHARMLAEIVGPVKDEARAAVEARLLARAEGKTVAQLRQAARRAVLRADAAAAAQRLARALRDRGVRMHPGRDGMATLNATMSLPVAAACRTALRAYADACATPGDERTLDQRMADCLADLILRPDVNGPVQIGLTLVAGVDTMAGGDEPGEIDGHPVPAVLVGELARTLGLLPRPDTTESDAPDDTPGPEAERPAGAGAAAAGAAAGAELAELLNLRSVTGTALTHLPRIAVIDEITGQLLALTDAPGLRRAATGGRGLGPPPATDGYTPSDPLARFVRARDRRCRFPGCRAAAIRCDAHHCTRWPDGDTSEANLCCLCRHHHRLTHQAPGWTMRRLPDGGLEWTSPGGQTITTHPLRYGTDDDLPPPQPPAVTPPEDDDPPPF